MKLYHYTTVDAFARIWMSNQLRFSTNLKLNDPFEKRKPYDLPVTPYNAPYIRDHSDDLNKMYAHVVSAYQQISFTRNYSFCKGYASPAMWGHYAHNENGVCIEFDSSKFPKIPHFIKKRSVAYRKVIPSLSYYLQSCVHRSDVEKFVKEHIEELFFVKHIHWKYENEYRIIAKSEEELFLPLENSIESVTVFSPSGSNTSFVEQLVQNRIPIYWLWTGGSKGIRQIERFNLNLLKTPSSNVTNLSDILNRPFHAYK